MPTDKCSTVRDNLPWLVNGSLGSGDRRPTWEHLSRCPSCREELRVWAVFHGGMKEARLPSEDARLDAVWERVQVGIAPMRPIHHLPFEPVGLPLDVMRNVVAWLGRRTAAFPSG